MRRGLGLRGAGVQDREGAAVKWLRFKIRWWRWFLFGMTPIWKQFDVGLDRDARDIIFRRWIESEPKSNLDR